MIESRDTAGRCTFSGLSARVFRVALAIIALFVASPRGLWAAGDQQVVAPSNGGETAGSLPATCIEAGANAVIDSVAIPDDARDGQKINAGPNGICNSPATPDDILDIPVGNGLANRPVIRTGPDGICSDAVVPGGDDVRTIPLGQGLSFMVTIRTGIDGTLETVPSGDDISTAVICAGDAVLSSTPDPADVVASHFTPLCLHLCQDISSCIIPGNDGTLQTTADPGDQLIAFISTGPNGVAQSTALPSDDQFVAVGQGFVSTALGETCIDSGANGVAETSICGNGILDIDENGSNVAGPACDDGNTVSGDGCDATCIIETGWACPGQPSVCAPVCGDHLQVGSEPCDDGNASNADSCLNVGGTCVQAVCGDGVRKTGGPVPPANELCDDGNLINGDGCDNNCTLGGCGNGVLNAGEICDDNNLVNGDGCDANCTLTGCGNGVITAGEGCDDANGSNLDACLTTCVLNVCGDGFLLTGTEQCDDSNLVSGDGCDANCTTTACGNGVVTAGEACDDGNTVESDVCLSTCAIATCGDGARKTSGGGPNEQCDDGNLVSGDGCDANCTTSRCGNGVVGAPETCDDTNSTNGDGCDNNCTITACGNGIRTSGEVCDDGNGSNQDNCLNTCVSSTCGDGFVKTNGTGPLEECEDGNLIEGDGCDTNCTFTGCGNGIPTAGEACDDGNSRNDDACVVGCQAARCGDGFRERTVEECDDGCLVGVPNVCEVGIDDDDSCNATCRRTRSPRCGNGVIEAPEGCDDGNSSDDDDCTNSCEIAQCGDGVVHDRQSGTEECDDGNAASGDGCSATCTRECGNGVLDFFCSEPESSAGQPCTSDAACDSVPSAGDGRCITGEVCDPGLAGLCVDDEMSPVCSNFCVIETCGNGLVECAEECDLGVVENADPGSGCTPGCTRSLAEEPSARECPAAFTVDLPPQPLPNQRETCRDGAACDFDQSVNGQCAFRIGVCLNLSEPGCTPGGLRTFDLLGVKIRGTCLAGRTGARCVVGQDCDTSAGAGDGNCVRDRAVVATTTLTDAVAALAPTGAASVPGRCRAGLKGKVCSVNNECDRAFGLGNGRCDIGTGVEFDPPLDGADQVGTCTPGQDIVVDAGSKLNLRSFVRRGSGPPDRDHLLLVCEP